MPERERDWEGDAAKLIRAREDGARAAGSAGLRTLSDPRIRKAALDLAWAEFAPVVDFERSEFDAEVRGTDPALSCAALDGRGRVVGAYLLGAVPPRGVLDIPGAKRLGAVLLPGRPVLALCGIALVVTPSERGSGLGRLLRDHPRRLGADLVVGEQAKCLDNLAKWLKVRELVAETEESWFTAAALAPDVRISPVPGPDPAPRGPSPGR